MVSSIIAVVLLAATVGLSESHIAGIHRPASGEETRIFGLPENAIIIADFDSKQLPYPQESAGNLCKAIERSKKCMNVSDDEPMHYGRGCTGTECYMHPHPGPASCLTNITGLHMDMYNTTRALTCGLDPEDDAVIHPEIPSLGPPSSNAHNHIIGLPEGIEVHVWHLCLKGKYHDVIRIKFSEVPSYHYECKGYPLCIGGNVHAKGICYSTLEFLVEYVDSAGQMHTAWWWLLIVLLVYFFGLEYMQ